MGRQYVHWLDWTGISAITIIIDGVTHIAPISSDRR